MSKEIKELEGKVANLEQKIKGLEKDLDMIYNKDTNIIKMVNCIRELQEEVARLSGQPVGILFDYMR
tara:strand:+ start:171 stop:371 length:201 start_codon:yes stop_codon:yes gene_type:complete